MSFSIILAENGIGNVVVSAPIGCTLCIGKLVRIVTIEFIGLTGLIQRRFGLSGQQDALDPYRIQSALFFFLAVHFGITAIKGKPIKRAKYASEIAVLPRR